MAAIRAHGGQIVREPYAEGDLWWRRFAISFGNVIGVWQMGPR